MKSRCSAFCCVIDHFRDNAFGQETDTGKADPYILHSVSTAFVGSTHTPCLQDRLGLPVSVLSVRDISSPCG